MPPNFSYKITTALDGSCATMEEDGTEKLNLTVPNMRLSWDIDSRCVRAMRRREPTFAAAV